MVGIGYYYEAKCDFNTLYVELEQMSLIELLEWVYMDEKLRKKIEKYINLIKEAKKQGEDIEFEISDIPFYYSHKLVGLINEYPEYEGFISQNKVKMKKISFS